MVELLSSIFTSGNTGPVFRKETPPPYLPTQEGRVVQRSCT